MTTRLSWDMRWITSTIRPLHLTWSPARIRTGTLVRLWLCLALLLGGSRAQIEDIILDLEDPADYVDQVLANMEREQAAREHRQVAASARCTVRCLAQRQRAIDLTGRRPSALDSCLAETECSACVRPCSQPFVNINFCSHHCQDASASCETSCRYLQTVYHQRAGQCPHTDHLTGYGALCTEACLVDSDCPEEDQKCCYNGCGHVCAQPSYHITGVPLVPDQPLLSELKPEGAVLLEWNSVATNRTGPVLYVVWVRWNVGKHHSDAHMTPWQQMLQTTDTTRIVQNIKPGHWYQYQVSAVNINGSRGASPPTRVFCLQREPTPPGVPVNLTEGDTLVQGNHVTVSVQWRPPADSDLPVTKYKVVWVKLLSPSIGYPVDADREHRHVILGDQLQFDVPDLDPEATYLVQVQAICQYGDARLKSNKASLYINTYPLSRAAQLVLPSTTPVTVERTGLQTPPPLTEIRVDSPFFQNGLLRANVSWDVIEDGSSERVRKVLVQWSPDACIADKSLDDGLPNQLIATTENEHYVIYELRFDCRYVVRLIPISHQGAMGAEARMSFVTPSCGEVDIQGRVRPDCPESVATVPEEPANLHHRFIIDTNNISAQLSWDPPLSDSPVTGYRVTWGQTLPLQPNVWDKNKVLTKVLTKDARSFRVLSLCEGVTYLVRVQALSRIGPGKVTTAHFTVPVLTSTTHRGRLTQYEIIDSPFGSHDNNVHKYPMTSKPHTWMHSASSLTSSSPNLHIICVILSLYYSGVWYNTNLTHRTKLAPESRSR